MKFSHIDGKGELNMVDVGEKRAAVRTAKAEALITMKPETLIAIRSNTLEKGDILTCAKVAGVQGAKKTHELIPLCHNIPIDKVGVTFKFESSNTIKIESYAKCFYKTGIEMEALTAVSVAALCIYDMCKAVDRSMVINHIKLIEKTGGDSGEYKAI